MFDLPETITVWNIAGNSGFGDYVYDGPFTYPARIAYKSEKFTDTNGDQLVSTAVCYSRGDQLKADSKVFFGSSISPTPISTADDARQISQTPSGAADLKKLWFA